MTRFVAQCPECRTAFRIDPKQLEVAEGLVRCGACLSVFAAAEHRVFLKDDEALSESGAATPEEQAREEARTTENTAASPVVEAADDDPDPPLVAEEQSVALPGLVREAGGDAEITEPGDSASKPRLFVDALDDEEGLGAIDRDELASLDAAPIEMEAARPARRGRTLLWLSANAVLILLLAAQVAWIRFDELLANPRYRPALEFLCRHAGCALATFRDLAAIESEELSVRSHPTRADALQVDFIFRNTAELPQDFPLVELNFHDIGGRLLANRLFTPQEYLADDLRALEKMPARVPVQVSLELLDPGPEAINYSLAFRLP